MGSPSLLKEPNFEGCLKYIGIVANLTSGGMMFQKKGAIEEKDCFLGIFRQNVLADRTHNMPFLLRLMRQVHVIRKKQSLK